MAYAMIGIGVIGFLVWGHHMFVSGQSSFASDVFSILSFVVAVPPAWVLLYTLIYVLSAR